MKKKIKDILEKGAYQVNGSLWIEGNGIHFFGPGPAELLERIEETGSINQAARKMNMSYKKAWEIVNRLNDKTVSPVVITTTGGKKGGGSSISEDAKQMIAYHRLLRERFTRFLQQETLRLK
jgi:molybdate transport system regulatory protein